jgi:phosphate transport system substrate-binding protein
VEYAYALQNKMAHALVQNRDGYFVSPNIDTFKAAAAGAQWDKAPGMYLILTDQLGKDAWPISGATFILVYKSQDKPDRAKQVLKFFDWAYTEGDKLAMQLDYVPLPDSVVALIQSSWKNQIKDASGKPVWP